MTADDAVGRVSSLRADRYVRPGRYSVWVWSRRAWFYLDQDRVITPDGILFVANAPGGTWIREIGPDAFNQSVTSWYYDGTGGDNDNDGLAASTPIKNIRELWLRCLGGTDDVTINLAAPLSDAESTLLSLLTAGDPRQWSTP